jgi:cell wall protein, putative (cell wall adhesin, putative) (cell surface flocculin, putative)
MSKFYKHQWFGRTSEYPNQTETRDEFYEGIRRTNDKERIAVEKYMSTEYDYKVQGPTREGFEVRMDMNLHPYYAQTHHHCQDGHMFHPTNEDTNCDYWMPTEKDVVNAKGYNATNIRIMHQVSKRISDLTKLLGLINDLSKPLDLAYIQCKCPWVDSSLFRTILSVAFTELLKKDTSLFHTLESLLNPVEPKKEQDPEPQKPGVDASTSTDDLHNSVHRPEYTNYPKISEEFIRKIIHQIYEEGNYKPTEEKPVKPPKVDEGTSTDTTPTTEPTVPNTATPTEGKPGTPDTGTKPVDPPVIPEMKPPAVGTDTTPVTPTEPHVVGEAKPTEGKPGTPDTGTSPVQPPVLPEVKPPKVETTETGTNPAPVTPSTETNVPEKPIATETETTVPEAPKPTEGTNNTVEPSAPVVNTESPVVKPEDNTVTPQPEAPVNTGETHTETEPVAPAPAPETHTPEENKPVAEETHTEQPATPVAEEHAHTETAENHEGTPVVNTESPAVTPAENTVVTPQPEGPVAGETPVNAGDTHTEQPAAPVASEETHVATEPAAHTEETTNVVNEGTPTPTVNEQPVVNGEPGDPVAATTEDHSEEHTEAPHTVTPESSQVLP